MNNSKWVVKSDKNGNVNLNGTATYATNSGTSNYTKNIASDNILVEYFTSTISMKITSTALFTWTFPLYNPTKTGYRLLDINYIGFGGTYGNIDSSGKGITSKIPPNGYQNNLKVPYLNIDSTTSLAMFWIIDAPSAYLNKSITHYFYFRSLWIKE